MFLLASHSTSGGGVPLRITSASPHSAFLSYFEDIFLNVSFHLIVFKLHIAHAGRLVNAIALCSFLARARVCNLIPGDHQIASEWLNVEAVSFFRVAVVQYL